LLAEIDKQLPLANIEKGSNAAFINLKNEIVGDREDKSAKPAAEEIVISGFPKLLPHITSRGNTTLDRVELYLKLRGGWHPGKPHGFGGREGARDKGFTR
jgi:hypothetical protein